MTEVIIEVALFFSLRGDGVGGIMIARSAIQANGTIGLLPLEWQRIPASHIMIACKKGLWETDI